MAEPARTRGHRTQLERRERTRTALLDATVESLVEIGYARASMQEICLRAGVSKGAVQHHFATKAELMAAAVVHLTSRVEEERIVAIGRLPEGAQRIPAAIDLLWQAYSGTLATAVTELWVAARTDPELRAAIRPVDRALGRSTLRAIASVLGDVPRERVEKIFWLTVNFTRGLALDAELGGAAKRRAELLAEWKRIMVALAAGPPAAVETTQ